ncbi:MAG TPA: glycosyltransferase family 2 protein [Verrucomicrobiae bacterium]|nr:glycosyltransferase family 2 protein [Verrucomicrobiae bacterium]
MDSPKVSFVTVNYKMPHFVRHLLQGVQDAGLPFSFEYFLVDNASGDGVLEMVAERFPWVKRMAMERNAGFGVGNNRALAEAKGEYVVFLNPDTVVFPGELEAWIDWMDKRPDVGASGPRVINPDGTDQQTTCRFPTLLTPVYRRTLLGKTPWGKKALSAYLMDGMDRSREQDVDWVQGSALCIRRSVLEKTGPFDERFFMYFEDADLCRRVWKSGSRVAYVPKARIVHYHGRGSMIRWPWQVVTNRLTRTHIVSSLKYFLKYRGERDPRQATG